jgi:hypothetical protein
MMDFSSSLNLKNANSERKRDKHECNGNMTPKVGIGFLCHFIV